MLSGIGLAVWYQRLGLIAARSALIGRGTVRRSRHRRGRGQFNEIPASVGTALLRRIGGKRRRMLGGKTARMAQDALGAATRRDRELRAAFRKLLGAYLIGTSVFVAAWFIINPFFDASGVWDAANYLMSVALIVALLFNLRRKLRGNADEDRDRVGDWERNLCLYLTTGVAILFFRNWFLEIAGAGGDDSTTTGLVWIMVNVLFPLTTGTAGVALWRETVGKGRKRECPRTGLR